MSLDTVYIMPVQGSFITVFNLVLKFLISSCQQLFWTKVILFVGLFLLNTALCIIRSMRTRERGSFQKALKEVESF